MLAPAPQKDRFTANQDICWFIVQTEARREAKAQESLEREDFNVWYPMVKAWVRPRRNRMSHSQRRRNLHISTEQVDKPAFPGYMFIQRGARSPGLARLFELTAVRGIVHFGEKLAMLDNSLVDKIRADVAGGILDQRVAVTPFSFKVTETVRVTDGVFAGFNATVDRIDGNRESIHVLAHLFGRQCRVALTVDQLEKL